MTERRTLAELAPGEAGMVTQIDQAADPRCLRLAEMGFLAGERVMVEHESPISGDPIAVWIRGGIVALRREEARKIILLESK